MTDRANVFRRFGRLLRSIVGAAFGVQSSEVQEEDFRTSSPWPYVIGGLLFTLLFILTLLWVVSRVLESTG